MTIRLQVIMLAVIIILFIYMGNQLRRRNLNLKYSLVWLFCIAGVALFCIFPDLLSNVSVFLGIETPVYALFLICIVVLTLICISLTVAVSRLNDRLRTITQNIAIKDYLNKNDNNIRLVEQENINN